MDETASLLQLLSSSTSQLQVLYEEIGDSGCTYQSAIQELHNTLTSSIQSHLKRAQDRKKEIFDDCKARNIEAQCLKEALGETSGSPPCDGAAEEPPLTLHQKQQRVHQEISNLRSVHTSRQAQADRMISQLEEQRQVLGDIVNTPLVPGSLSDGTIRALPLSYISALEAETKKGEVEVKARTSLLQDQLQTILNLWSALHLTPEVNQDEFDAQILTHLQVKPIWHVGPETGGRAHFYGDFEHFKNTTGEVEVFCPPEMVEPTPTRKSNGSGGSRNSNGNSGGVDQAPQCLQIRQRKPLEEWILPTKANLERVAAKLAALEAEKAKREERIQQLYDELSEIWMQFDVPQDEMETFVHANSGSTLEAIEAYRRELQKMQDLRREHMSLFIEKLRERIRRLWDTLRLSDIERYESFPQCFVDSEGSTEEALALHEEAIVRLAHEVKTKEPVLQAIRRYQELCDEEKQMEEDAKNPNRFKNTRGDPGRLLREEKTRKRIKVQKPKLVQELLKMIPAWKEEHGKEFTIDGVPYLTTLQETLTDPSTRDFRKRNRTISNSSTMSDGPALGPSSFHNRTAATPIRVPTTPATGSIAKKPKLGQLPPSSARSTASTMPPPSTATTRPGTSRITKLVVNSHLRPPGGRTVASPSSEAPTKFCAPPVFRPRPSGMLQTYITSGGGRKSADSPQLHEQIAASRTASQSSDRTIIIHERHPPSHSLQDTFTTDTSIRSVQMSSRRDGLGLRSAISAGPNWMPVPEEDT
ncbi:hypothetical protein K437DRAFT_254032 [Tilletiaria anomala UBC 951]|uniref:Microtubule associated protein n=1 Tax=Tilletiaria anomala (strain ATCC 24038 / CBS 436.72 / UBC 951) TaxID=1037660 RepID=A0A066WPS5_TILAU|nr:uncharacterized protein K437DRAFT_254032 [Tilletiaria anomala UBC 951]KDN52630.1 hypothetical protein K437DRAFT_254032 [Tilletiaria anomala UBC 951]